MGISSTDLQSILKTCIAYDADLKNLVVYAEQNSFNYSKAAEVACKMSDFVIRNSSNNNESCNKIKNIFKAVLYDMLVQARLSPPVDFNTANNLSKYAEDINKVYSQIKPVEPLMGGPSHALKATSNYEGISDDSMSNANSFIDTISKPVTNDVVIDIPDLVDMPNDEIFVAETTNNKNGLIHPRGTYMESYTDHEIVITPSEIKTSPVVRTKQLEIYKSKPELVISDLQKLLEASNVVVFGDSSILAKTTVNKTVHLAYDEHTKESFLSFYNNHKTYKEQLLKIENEGVTVDFMKSIVNIINLIIENAENYSNVIKTSEHTPDVSKIEMLGFVAKYFNIISGNIYDAMSIGLNNGVFSNGSTIELKRTMFLPELVSTIGYESFIDAAGICTEDAVIRNAFLLLIPNVCKLHFKFDNGVVTFKENKVSIITDIDYTETYMESHWVNRKTFGFASDVITEIFDFISKERPDSKVVLCIGGVELKLFKSLDAASPIYY